MKSSFKAFAFAVCALTLLPACGYGKKDCKPCNTKKETSSKKESCAPCNRSSMKSDKEDYAI